MVSLGRDRALPEVPRRLSDRLPFHSSRVRVPSFRPVVATSSNRTRTQNGHIRNDTRDASRRTLGARRGQICRQNCVTGDRASTRVTLRNLHGKEGFNGSSPSEGSTKVPLTGLFGFLVQVDLQRRRRAPVMELSMELSSRESPGPSRPRRFSRQTGRFDCSARLRSSGRPGRGGSSGFPTRGRLGV